MSNVTLVESTLWTGATGQALRRLGHAYQVVGAYLITAPGKSIYGLYRLPMTALCEHAAIDREQALVILRTLADLKFAFYDIRVEWVWIVTMAWRQLSTNGVPLVVTDRRVQGMHAWYATVAANPYLGAFYDYYAAMFHMPKRREGLPAPENTLFDIVPAKPAAIERSTRAVLEKTFEMWWKRYPPHRKVGKAIALEKWCRVRPVMDEVRTMKAIETLERQKRTAEWLEQNGRFVPHPKTYIHQGRMFDEVADAGLPSLSPDDVQLFDAMSKLQPPPEDDNVGRKRLKGR